MKSKTIDSDVIVPENIHQGSSTLEPPPSFIIDSKTKNNPKHQYIDTSLKHKFILNSNKPDERSIRF
jgi:hypothetical protein